MVLRIIQNIAIALFLVGGTASLVGAEERVDARADARGAHRC